MTPAEWLEARYDHAMELRDDINNARSTLLDMYERKASQEEITAMRRFWRESEREYVEIVGEW